MTTNVKNFSCFSLGRMMALPVGFLPFDPSRDNKDSDDEDDEESSPESDEELNEDTLHDSIVNGENNHQQKSARHIGGGVLLVREYIFIHIQSLLQ
jgi:hypothetical protein